MEKKFEKLEKFVTVVDKLFPSFISLFDFWMMVIFLLTMCIFSFKLHDTVGTLLTALGATYCMNEWDKRIKKE